MKNDPRLPSWLFLLLFTILTLVFYLTSCTGVGTNNFAWKNHQPASIIKNEVNFTYRGDYRNLNDFLRRVKSDLAFLRKQGYKIIKVEYEYGRDMTQKTIACFAVIHYEEKK